MKMNINFQVTGNDRKKVATYTILFPQFQKHKISLIMMSWFYLQSSLKRVKKRIPPKKQQKTMVQLF